MYLGTNAQRQNSRAQTKVLRTVRESCPCMAEYLCLRAICISRQNQRYKVLIGRFHPGLAHNVFRDLP